MFVGQAAGWETAVLQHEIAMRELVAPDPFFGVTNHPYLLADGPAPKIEGVLCGGKLSFTFC